MNASSRSPASSRFPHPAPAPSQPDEPGRRAHPQGGSAYPKISGSEPVSPYKSIRSPNPKGPSHRLRRDPRPIKTIHQHGELRRRQSNDPALDRRPGEAALSEPLGREDQTGAVISQDLHPIGSLGSKDEDRRRVAQPLLAFAPTDPIVRRYRNGLFRTDRRRMNHSCHA